MAQRLVWYVVTAWAIIIWTIAPVKAEATLNPQPAMVIEWLKFRVEPAQRDRYLAIDSEIWTSALATYPGFIDKSTWLDPNHDDEVIFVISWATREQWKAIPEEDLDEINQRFDQTLGIDYEMLESQEFIVPVQ